MNTCPKCSYEIKGDDNYCSRCGQRSVSFDVITMTNNGVDEKQFRAIPQIQPAHSNRRLFNFVIDLVVVNILIRAAIVLTGFYGYINGYWLEYDVYVLDLVVIAGYYLTCEFFFGRTVAKLITRTRVVSSDGGKSTLKQIAIRTVVRLVPFEIFSFFGTYPVGWHDKWSGTRVV